MPEFFDTAESELRLALASQPVLPSSKSRDSALGTSPYYGAQ